MLYLTGDCHADFTRFSSKRFVDQKEMTRDDTVIVCGDFGGIWDGSAEEQYWLNWLSQKPFTLCFVDGNHENFSRLNREFDVVDFHGGKAHKIRGNIYHLMRGYVFDFEGKKFFAFGGASSHDIQDGILDPADFATREEFKMAYSDWCKSGKMFRVNRVSWWEEELPSREEMDNGIASLQKCNWEVDYVISHSLPQEICSILGFYESDRITRYFNQLLRNKLKFKEWHAGHFHFCERIYGKYYIHYHDIMRLI